MGPHTLGCRATTADLHPVVLDLFPDAIAGGNAQPNLSVLVGEAEGATRAKSVLYVNNIRVVATASRGRLLRALVRGLEHTVAAADTGYLELPGTALVRGPKVVFVDRAFGPGVRDEQARLRRLGWKVWDAPAVLLDLSTDQLVSPPSVAAVDPDVLAAITAADPVEATELAALDPINADDVVWVVPDQLRDSPAGHLLGLARSGVSFHGEGTALRLSALASFVARGETYHSKPGGGRQLLTELETLIG